MIVGVTGTGYCGYRLYKHVRTQDEGISSLQQQLYSANLRLDKISPSIDADAEKFIKNCDQKHYNILFIGNSITRHAYADYWWSDKRGMASSSLGKDYVHQTVKKLDSYGIESIKRGATDGLNFYAANCSVWEHNPNDREESYPVIDKYFPKENLDCLVLQFGENVADADDSNSTFESDYKTLIDHIKEELPKTQIITIGTFWEDEIREKVKKKVADEEGVDYVDLSEIADKPYYEAGIGTKVEGDDGKIHEIEHSGVAIHPGDRGMNWIAKALSQEIIDKDK